MDEPNRDRQDSLGQPMVVIFATMALGIGSDRVFNAGPFFWWAASAVLWLLWLALSRRGTTWAGWSLLLSIACVAGAWHNECWRRYPVNHVGLQVFADAEPRPAAIRGSVLTTPEFGSVPAPNPLATIPLGIKSTFEVRASEIRHGDQWIPASGKVSVRVDGHVLGLNIDDETQIYGTLTPPTRPMNPGQHDGRIALRTQRILCRMEVPYPDCVSRLRRSKLSRGAVIGRIRLAGLSQLDRFVGNERGPLAGALVMGARDRLQSERVESFFHTGTIHLLAISGLHVGILAWGFFVVAKNTPLRRWSLVMLVCLTVVYCVLTGMRPPVLRAAILVQVACIGLFWRRNVVAFNALAAAAVCVLVWQPGVLFRPGAQLSFLAVATLIWLGRNWSPGQLDPLQRLVHRTRPWPLRSLSNVATRTKQLFLAGLAIWFVTTPLVMFRFHLVSPVSLILNVVLALPIAISLLTGFAVLVFGNFLPPVARICGVVCDANLAFVESAVESAEEIPGAFFWVAGPTAVWCALFYVGLLILAIVPSLQPSKRWAVAAALLWLTTPIAGKWALSYFQQEAMQCSFLSVGHGTCVVLEMPDDRVLLYDCGRMGVPHAGVRLVSEFLWHRGILHIDGVVLSHADADHYNMLPGLLERFSVGQVLVSPRMLTSPGEAVRALRDSLQNRSIPVRHLRLDDVMRFGDVSLRVCHPPAEGVGGSDNANSIVLEVSYGTKRVLLPGDLESPGIEPVLAEPPIDCDVLMAPHHGSPRSAPKDFTRWCTPEWVVVSSGRSKNHDPQWHEPFSHNGASVLRTAESGAVTVLICNERVHVKAFVRREDP